MTTPYWGQLPPPKARRQSGSSEKQYESNRASVQTTTTDAPTDSTCTPFASPTTSSLAGGGLAPRPPSHSYARDDIATSDQPRIDENDAAAPRFLRSPLLPRAPDVPSGPPVSYRLPFRSASSSYTYDSTGRPGPPHRSRRHASLADSAEMDSGTFYDDGTPPPERQPRIPSSDAPYQSLGDGIVSPEHLERELIRSGSIRRPSKAYRADRPDTASPGGRDPLAPEPQQQKMWAADRSPLQKLELTLDSITKEEKRARVEAAERRARERAARLSQVSGTADQKKVADGSGRQQGRSGHVEQGHPTIVKNSVRAAPSAATSYSPVSQNAPPEARLSEPAASGPVPQNRDAPTAIDRPNGTPRRNLSFRERAGPPEPSYPQGTVPDVVPTRSGSKKLQKSPPGEPFRPNRRTVEERNAAYNRLTSTEGLQPAEPFRPDPAPANAPVRAPSKLTKEMPYRPEDPPRPPARGKWFPEDHYEEERPSRMKGFAAALGLGRSNSMGAGRRPSLLGPGQHSRALSTDDAHLQSANDPAYRHNDTGSSAEMGRAYSVNLGRQPPRPVSGLRTAQPGERAPKSVKFDDGHHDGMTDHEARATHHKHIREYLHYNRLKPGQGIYQPPVYLDEWKWATVGVLSGDLLNLEGGDIPSADRSSAWWENNSKRRPSTSARPVQKPLVPGNPESRGPTSFKPPLYLKCGPLLRYCGIRNEDARDIWRGSVMIVTQDSESTYNTPPVLRLFAQPMELLPPPPAELAGGQALLPEYVDPIAGIPKIGSRGETLYVRPVEHLEEARDLSMVAPDDGLFEVTRSAPDYNGRASDPPGSFTSRKRRTVVDGEKVGKHTDVSGFRLHAERGHTFWRFNIEVELLDGQQQRIAYRINQGPATGFWVPPRGESMNIMFHSCNGFSASVNPDSFSGPDPMWRDVLNTHQTRPFHVMIGGGDQVYNDVVTHKAQRFNEWLGKNMLHKSNAPLTPEMQDELEAFYLDRYMMWFSQGLFGLANSQIPMVNMYDDHDIIDGFGSYPDHLMRTPVFSGLGNIAFKYYLLFQHQSIPDETEEAEPSWCLGKERGPYIKELSRSLFISLGAGVALLAVDTRAERTRDEVVSELTWKGLMDRCYAQIAKHKTKHLLVLLGVPIAYPRLVWLETILTSRLMDPIKALGKFGLLRNFLNNFDGGVEVLDDLDDHWTAKNHKHERQLVIEDLQDLAADKSVRVTILSGDVHLAAVGQFYSNPKLRIPKHHDFRYMPNIISSAIANTPPPDLMADVLNKRNKVHHFDKETEEDMIPLFTHGVDGKSRNNKHLLPHRNWCSIRKYVPGYTPPPTPPPEEFEHTPDITPPGSRGGLFRRFSLSKDRGPAMRPDVPKEQADRSRPPISGGGFMRTLSRRGSVSEPQARPNRAASRGGGLMRTLSLGARPLNLFRRNSTSNNTKHRPDDGGINGSWGPEEEDDYYEDDQQQYMMTAPQSSHAGVPTPLNSRNASVGLRGGGEGEYEVGDEAYFTARRPLPQPQPPRRAMTQPIPTHQKDLSSYYDPQPGNKNDSTPSRPFHRTPTGLSFKKRKEDADPAIFDVDVEGGLEICLNVEVNPKDPAGITVPYRLLVPRLDYEDEEDDDDSVGDYERKEAGVRPYQRTEVGVVRPPGKRTGGGNNNDYDLFFEQQQKQRVVKEEGGNPAYNGGEEPPEKKVSGLRRFFSGRRNSKSQASSQHPPFPPPNDDPGAGVGETYHMNLPQDPSTRGVRPQYSWEQ
ncbi:hypothetical protein F5Y17DRAFT_17687 [Xylariaceae sp. FL0594]|nr:hypothetical protein F5Y17DRAFT_17687 [Xylariaceae sp. FL0594]